MSARYGVYFTPPVDHALWRAGCEWLGRDPSLPAAPPPARAGVSEPWRYGFHATLKPPMLLAPGRDEAGFRAALSSLAERTARFPMPVLSVQMLRDFLALRPERDLDAGHPLRRLADACVVELDAWRAAPSVDELKRRLAEPLSARQRALLQQHGYPHVLDEWHFHMTLANRHEDGLLPAAQAHFAAALSQPLICDAISLFVEAAPRQPLRLVHRFALA